MDQGMIDGLRDKLLTEGSAMFEDKDGRKLMLVSSAMLSFVPADEPSLLIAYEGQGAFLAPAHEKISPFRLIQAGFSLRVAPTLADILNRVLAGVATKVGTSMPLLNAPRGMEEKE